MAALVVGTVSRAGLLDNMVAAAGGGDTFVNNGKTIFEVNNGGGGSINVTFTPTQLVNGETVAPRVVAVLNGTRKKIGPFDTGLYNDGSGNVAVTYSGVTTVTVQALSLP